MTKDRLIAFSDGVFAILITILVLDFTVPAFQSGHLLKAMAMQWPIFIAYAVSYFYVGTLWLFHHDLFTGLSKINRRLNLINLAMLFSITLINYPMSLVANTLAKGNGTDIKVAFISYDIVALLISFTFFVIYAYISRHPEFIAKHNDATSISGIRYDPLISVSLYAIGIVTILFSIPIGIFFFLAGIAFHFIAYLRLSTTLADD